MAPQARGGPLRGRALRWLLPVVVLLLAAGVLAMHGLGTGHGLTATGYNAAHAGTAAARTGHEDATAGHHHGAGSPFLNASTDQAASDLAAVGGGASTWASARPVLTAVAALNHLTSASSVPAGEPARLIGASGASAGDAPCQDDCGAHDAVMVMCLAVLAVALALLLARGPAALWQPWTALQAPTLLRGLPLVLHRAPGLHQLCVSRT